MRTQLPFHTDNDFQQPNYFMQMLIRINSMYCSVCKVSIKMLHLGYKQRHSQVHNLSLPV